MSDISLERISTLRRGRRESGARGPFDDDRTSEDVLRRVGEFLRRTGLQGHTQYFKIGAFLARRQFGTRQAEFLQQEHAKEDQARHDEEERLRQATNGGTLGGASLGRPDIDAGPVATENTLRLRREYDLQQLMQEGNRGRWHIYMRQNWHVHALIFCCSLGAVIQGWDESAINGGMCCYMMVMMMSGD